MKAFDWLVGDWRAEVGPDSGKNVTRYSVERRLKGQVLTEELTTKEGDKVVFEFLRVTRWDPEAKARKATMFRDFGDLSAVWSTTRVRRRTRHSPLATKIGRSGHPVQCSCLSNLRLHGRLPALFSHLPAAGLQFD